MESSPSDKYLVYSAYYKHAYTQVEFFESQGLGQAEFNKYLCDTLLEYDYEHYRQEIRQLSIEDKISYALEQGADRIRHDVGWGIVHVARISGDVELYE